MEEAAMATRVWPRYTQECAALPFRGRVLEHAGQSLGRTAETKLLQTHAWAVGAARGQSSNIYAVGSSNTDILEHSIISFPSLL